MRVSTAIHLLAFGIAVRAFPARHVGDNRPYRVVARQEEVEDPNKLDITGTFGTTVALQGGNIQQDVLYAPGVVGALEVEFSNADGRSLKVKEVTEPGSPPAGFALLEPVAYKIKVKGGSAKNLTLSKVDYIQNAASTIDISQGQIGLLDKATNTYVIGGDTSIGEIEFEADERELTLKVNNLKGEWAILIPTAAAAAAAAAPTAAANKTAAT
ncbi:accumulation-associated protein [Ophiostoma piceae UAMH 11346]|uniref:Accumulation-associated protein n=1 Tax=Ophiostoma piceae (strain UAMH 11346) TaxID=1262450 RepID=S3C8N3_OPHP1|nr:accumulation-associated protein [Ophiostoma piceae UAMH 11346]